jgi:putative endonuclease
MARHHHIGKQGEAIAQQYLEGKGYQILETNWRYRRAEVDLIAMDGPILVFVEVKTRSNDAYGQPEEGITARKEQMLVSAAHAYLEQNEHEDEIRFDVVSILYLDEESYSVRHLEDAFFW